LTQGRREKKKRDEGKSPKGRKKESRASINQKCPSDGHALKSHDKKRRGPITKADQKGKGEIERDCITLDRKSSLRFNTAMSPKHIARRVNALSGGSGLGGSIRKKPLIAKKSRATAEGKKKHTGKKRP